MAQESCHNSLGDAFDPETRLTHSASHDCHSHEEQNSGQPWRTSMPSNEEEILDRAVENAVMRALFPSDLNRRNFMKLVGSSTAAAIIASVFPMNAAKAIAAQGMKGGLEMKDVTVGFIPITCATPIIMS